MLSKLKNAEVVFSAPGIEGRRLKQNRYCEYVYLRISSGAIIPPHALDMPVTFFVISGQPQVVCNGDSMLLDPGDLLEVSPGLLREWKNLSDQTVELLVVKLLYQPQ